MSFQNPVVGGTTLIRESIHSPDYEPGVKGWTINRDGTAEFSDVTVRGDIELGPDSVHQDNIAPGAVGADELADGAVGTDELADGSVTGGKLTAALVLSSRIIAGDPAGAHVELNSAGIEAVDPSGTPTFTVDAATGDVALTGSAQSANFNPDAEDGVTGWQITKDGNAVFSDVSVGGSGYFIDQNGNGAINDLSVNGALTYGGTLLEDLFAARPKGILFWGAANTISASANSSTETMFLEVDTVLENGRMYRIATTSLLINGTVAGDVATVRLRDGGASSPTNTSNLLTRVNCRINSTTAGLNDCRLEIVVAVDDSQAPSASVLNSGVHRLALSLGRPSGTGSVSMTTSNGTVNPVTLYVEDLGPLVDNVGQQFANSGGGGTVVKQTYTKTYNATWSRFWDNGGDSVNTTNGEIAQGQYSSTFGNRISWVGFPFSTIQSDLSGATVKKVEFYLYFDHWYNNAGGTAVIGTHNSTATSAPAYDGSKDDQDRKRVSGWAINAGKWVDMTSVVGSEFKTGASTGIVIGKGPSTSHEYYGKARGFGESGAPKIRITYLK